jgi:molybdate transport system substrate-binding protein
VLRILALGAACALGAQGGSPAPLTVSAAISLTEVMEDVAKAYRAAGGGPVLFNFGGSNMLARQIVNGAPVDVFISADSAQMQVVERAGRISPGTVVPLLSNQLAVIVRKGRAAPVSSVAALAGSGVRRVAIGDPAAVPAGVYAKQYLERAGLWQALEPKLLPSGSVRAALAAVESGAADAAIVYATDARTSHDVRIVAVVAGPDAPLIVYPAAVVAASRRGDAALGFLKFLQTPAANAIFKQYGFQPLASAR